MLTVDPDCLITALAGFWALAGIPVAIGAVSQRGEVTRAETGYDTGSVRGFRSTTVFAAVPTASPVSNTDSV